MFKRRETEEARAWVRSTPAEVRLISALARAPQRIGFVRQHLEPEDLETVDCAGEVACAAETLRKLVFGRPQLLPLLQLSAIDRLELATAFCDVYPMPSSVDAWEQVQRAVLELVERRRDRWRATLEQQAEAGRRLRVVGRGAIA